LDSNFKGIIIQLENGASRTILATNDIENKIFEIIDHSAFLTYVNNIGK
jgi:hypothetical protein